MSSLRKVLFVLVLAMFANMGSIVAQINELVASVDDFEFVENELRTDINIKDVVTLDKSKNEVEDVEALERAYDAKVLENFGVYFNPISSTFKIKTSNKFDFTKIQITDTDSGKAVHKSLFDYYDNVVDLSKIASGNYMVILTDDNSNIHSEAFSIVN